MGNTTLTDMYRPIAEVLGEAIPVHLRRIGSPFRMGWMFRVECSGGVFNDAGDSSKSIGLPRAYWGGHASPSYIKLWINPCGSGRPPGLSINEEVVTLA